MNVQCTLYDNCRAGDRMEPSGVLRRFILEASVCVCGCVCVHMHVWCTCMCVAEMASVVNHISGRPDR